MGRKRRTHEEYEIQLCDKEIDYWPLEQYQNNQTKILHECLEGHKWKVQPSSILRGHGCPYCVGNARKTTEEYRIQIPEGYELLEPYVTNKTPIRHRHTECGQAWRVQPSNILGGSGCPNCASYGFNPGKPAILYYVCFDETYYKLGITNRSVSERFSREKGISIKTVWEKYFDTGADALALEKEIKITHKEVLGAMTC